MGTQHVEGIGAHKMWGYTPAQDLLIDTPIGTEVSRTCNSTTQQAGAGGQGAVDSSVGSVYLQGDEVPTRLLL